MPIALGMAISAKILKQKHKVFVIVGDGEINEDQLGKLRCQLKTQIK